MRFLHPGSAYAAKFAVPQQSWVGMGSLLHCKRPGQVVPNLADRPFAPAAPRITSTDLQVMALRQTGR